MKIAALAWTAALMLYAAGSPADAAEPWDAVKGREFTFVVGYGAGGSTDATTRILAKKLTDMGINAKVVNKPGAGGTEGTYWAAQQSPKSGILLAATPTAFHFLAAAEKTGYSWKDFEPIAMWSSAAFAFVVPEDSKYKTMQDLITAAKQNPGKISIGSTGSGGEYQYIIDKIFSTAGTSINYVGFKGGGEVTTNLLGGHIDAGYISVAGAAPLVDAGKMRFLAHTAETGERLAAYPDVPHVRKLGYDEAQNSSYALWAPKGSDSNMRKALAAAVEAAVKDPEVVSANQKLGLTIIYKGPEELLAAAQEIETKVVPDYVKWSKR